MVLASTSAPDQVPALNLALVGGTVVLLDVVTNIYDATQGAFDWRGPQHHPALPGRAGQPPGPDQGRPGRSGAGTSPQMS